MFTASLSSNMQRGQKRNEIPKRVGKYRRESSNWIYLYSYQRHVRMQRKNGKGEKTCDSMRCFYSIFSFIYDKIECESKRKSGARPYISSDILIIEQASNKYSAHWMTTQKGVIVFSANVWKCWVFYGMAGGREREKSLFTCFPFSVLLLLLLAQTKNIDNKMVRYAMLWMR